MYSLWIYYKGYNPSKDIEIENTIRKERNGSGSDFTWRDMDFSFDTKEEAQKAAESLMGLGLIDKFKIIEPILN